MKLHSFVLSDTLYVVLYFPLVDKSLEFNPILKKSIRCLIQDEYIIFRSDAHYISFPVSTDILACQVSNGQYCDINSPLYTADTLSSCSYALFLQN